MACYLCTWGRLRKKTWAGWSCQHQLTFLAADLVKIAEKKEEILGSFLYIFGHGASFLILVHNKSLPKLHLDPFGPGVVYRD